MWTLWDLLAMILYNILLPVFDTGDRRKQVRNVIIAFAMGMIISCSVGTDNFLAANRVVTFLPFYLTGYYGKINGTVMDYLSNNIEQRTYEMENISAGDRRSYDDSPLVYKGTVESGMVFRNLFLRGHQSDSVDQGVVLSAGLSVDFCAADLCTKAQTGVSDQDRPKYIGHLSVSWGCAADFKGDTGSYPTDRKKSAFVFPAGGSSHLAAFF